MTDEKQESAASAIEAVKVRVLPNGNVTRKDAGKIFGRTPKTMADWAAKGWGPPPITVGGRVFHRYADCIAMANGERPICPDVAA